jgi:hypothetical protein
LTNRIQFSGDILGAYTESAVDEEEKKVAVYFEVVPILVRTEEYRVNRRTVKREILIGKQACQKAVEALRAKTRKSVESESYKSE